MSENRALNTPAEIPAELNRWNWGAFFLNWIWGIGNSVFIALLCLIPVVNLVMMIVLGLKGSEWAWRNRAWRDAEHFRSVQRKWAIAGVAIWVLVIGGIFTSIASVPYAIKNSEVYAISMDAARANQQVNDSLGDGWDDAFWVFGSLAVNAGGAGQAAFSIPVSGPKGSGSLVTRGIRTGGVWDVRLAVLYVEGRGPIVLINKDNLTVPNAPVDI